MVCSFLQLFAVRLLMGVAIGADYSVGWPLLAEFAPARKRGKLMSLSEVAWYLGFMLAFAIGYVTTSAFDLDWRIVLGSSTLPAVILFLARLGLPESPRWLMNQGRTEEAHQVANDYLESPAEAVDLTSESDRLDITGARWGLPGAEAVLRLRAIVSNGDLNPYWRFHTAREHERLYPNQQNYALTA